MAIGAKFAPLRTVVISSHAVIELTTIVAIGTTGAGILMLRQREGRKALGLGLALLVCFAALGGCS